MSETVRLVSDGEEMVTSQGGQPVRHPSRPEVVVRLSIQYMGFRDGDGRREYLLDARRGDQSRRYVVWIDLAAFSRRQARLQDGPDISYQKLVRELAASALEGSDLIQVTDDELTAYRDTHTPPPRKSFSPPARPPLASPAADASTVRVA